MDRKHYNELCMISQQIHDHANQLLREYLEKTYSEAGPETMGEQLEDWLFVAEETSGYLLGNVIAMLEPDSQEEAIRNFEGNLRKVISYAEKKQADTDTPERLQ